MYYSVYSFDRDYDHPRYHPYRRTDRGYLSDEFKKMKPPNFDGELNNTEDA